MTRPVLPALLLLSLCACERGAPPAQPRAASPVPQAPAPTPPPAAAPAPPPRAPEPELPLELRLRLENERAARPSGTPRAEDVFAALGKAGLALEKVEQHLGAPFGARYCSSAQSAQGLRVSVCEYESAEAARAGEKKGVTPAPGARQRVLRNRATLLRVLQPQPTAQGDAAAKRAATAFRSL